MTNREKVLARCPFASCQERFTRTSIYGTSKHAGWIVMLSAKTIGIGETAKKAWADAAKRIELNSALDQARQELKP